MPFLNPMQNARHKRSNRLFAAAALTWTVIAHHAAIAGPPLVSGYANAPGWITINWYHAQNADLYTLELRDGTILFSSPQPEVTYTIASLKADTVYEFRVCARSAAPTECSAFVAIRTLKAPAAASPLPSVAISNVVATQHSLMLQWQSVMGYDYLIARLEDDESHEQYDVKPTPNAGFAFHNLQIDSRYRLMLKGCNRIALSSNSCGPWSVTEVRTKPPPQIEIGKTKLTVSNVGGIQIKLAFETPTTGDVVGEYRIFRNGQLLAGAGAQPTETGYRGEYLFLENDQGRFKVCFITLYGNTQSCSNEDMRPLRRSDQIVKDAAVRDTRSILRPPITPAQRSGAQDPAPCLTCKPRQ